MIHGPLDRRFVRVDFADQIAFERFAAHEADDGAGRVVAAGLVPAGDEFLEDLAEHFRIDGDFDVEGGGFLNGEIVAIEQAVGAEQGGEGGIGEGVGLYVEVVFVEGNDVEEWKMADEFGVRYAVY